MDIEIETFIHGAMCYAYSGKCMLSSFLGGRSGNRGRCAQPCRKCYEMQDKKAYIMSLKDMCSLENIPALIEAGIDSFKIEGRMKKPEYVAGTVRAYRRAVDMYLDGAWDLEKIDAEVWDMRDIYNRGGFSKGYYFMKNGPEMIAESRPNHTGVKIGKVESIKPPFINIRLERPVNPQDVIEIRKAGVELTTAKSGKTGEILAVKGNNFKKIRFGMEVFRTRNNALLEGIRKDVIEPEKTLKANALGIAREGEPLTVKVGGALAEAEVKGSIVRKAVNRATDEAAIKEKMKKTGGSGIIFEVQCELDPDIFIPMSEFNELRRRAAESFKEKLIEKYYRR